MSEASYGTKIGVDSTRALTLSRSLKSALRADLDAWRACNKGPEMGLLEHNGISKPLMDQVFSTSFNIINIALPFGVSKASAH